MNMARHHFKNELSINAWLDDVDHAVGHFNETSETDNVFEATNEGKISGEINREYLLASLNSPTLVVEGDGVTLGLKFTKKGPIASMNLIYGVEKELRINVFSVRDIVVDSDVEEAL